MGEVPAGQVLETEPDRLVLVRGDGSHVEVVDGDLVVLDGLDGRRVALFAAGTWVSAQVED